MRVCFAEVLYLPRSSRVVVVAGVVVDDDARSERLLFDRSIKKRWLVGWLMAVVALQRFASVVGDIYRLFIIYMVST